MKDVAPAATSFLIRGCALEGWKRRRPANRNAARTNGSVPPCVASNYVVYTAFGACASVFSCFLPVRGVGRPVLGAEKGNSRRCGRLLHTCVRRAFTACQRVPRPKATPTQGSSRSSSAVRDRLHHHDTQGAAGALACGELEAMRSAAPRTAIRTGTAWNGHQDMTNGAGPYSADARCRLAAD